jgi:predicted SprT family Zn-dependent metalloprotease
VDNNAKDVRKVLHHEEAHIWTWGTNEDPHGFEWQSCVRKLNDE